ncbi:MAG TPA: L,D-transpeptidase [Actinomycetota bacterium]|nr:L,D-transpeptidase [Actinomycetota bacterium]
MFRLAIRIFPVALLWITVTACGLDSVHPFSEEAYDATELAPVSTAGPATTEQIDLLTLADKGESLVAMASGPNVGVFRRPQGERFTSFRNPGPFDVPRVFLVEKVREDWLKVLLPVRPNGTTGWVRVRDVEIGANPYSIQVDLSDKNLTVSRRDRIIAQATVAVGKTSTPTPTGTFYTTVLVASDDPAGPYGPYAFGLSAYSDVLTEFAGGPGQIAIHGTNDPSALGQAVSFGCIRVENPLIQRLAGMLPLGTPVHITS